MSYYAGIDIGGTFIKGGIIDEKGTIHAQGKVSTPYVYEEAVNAIATLVTELAARVGVTVEGIGIGTPSTIDSENGIVIYSSNIGWRNVPLAEDVVRETGVRQVKLLNDANAAALGEYAFGAGQGSRHMVMITLGTGVGCGIVIDGQLYEGNRSAGAEPGHMVIRMKGLPCNCGHRGCWEAYASTGALTRQAWRHAEAHRDGGLWTACHGNFEEMNGVVIFDAVKAGDRGAKAVVNRYLDYVSIGLISLANTLRPEVIVIGGGISAAGEAITRRLQKRVNARIFGGADYAPLRVVPATRGNDAGMLGAVRFLLDSLAR